MPLLDNPIFVWAIMNAWSFLVKYWPKLKDVPNRLIPLMNVAIGVITLIASATAAHAGFFDYLGAGWRWAQPIALPILQQIFFEFVKPGLQHIGITGNETPPVGRSDSAMRRSPS